MKKFVILSLKRSEPNSPAYYLPEFYGYTSNPWKAGIYTQAEIDSYPEMNIGVDTIAIDIESDSALQKAGLSFAVNEAKVKTVAKNQRTSPKSL